MSFSHLTTLLTQTLISLPRPLVDPFNYVMMVVANGPNREAAWWTRIIKQATQACGRLRLRSRSADGSTPTITFGIGFGTRDSKYPVSGLLSSPHR
jgi:hypothetical protein